MVHRCPHATGMLVEDPNGNYNFQTSNAVEYTITPNDPTNFGVSTLSVKTAPGDPYYAKGIFEKRYSARFKAATNGIWVLKLQRSTLFSVPFDTGPTPVIDGDACEETPHTPATHGVIYFDSCGVFYFTGTLDQSSAAGSYSQLATDLATENSNGFEPTRLSNTDAIHATDRDHANRASVPAQLLYGATTG
jgi:hypothetical protein